MNRVIGLIIVLALAGGGAYWYMNRNKAADPAAAVDPAAAPADPAAAPADPAAAPADPAAPPAQ